MQNNPHLNAQQMTDKTAYGSWVGVVLGLLLSGSAHFLSGERATGIRWYILLFTGSFVTVALVTIPGNIPFMIGVIFGCASLMLWGMMLRQSYRPVRRIGIFGWIAVVLISIALNNTLSLLKQQFMHPFRLPTGGMKPTLVTNDYVMMERLSYRFGKPERGDIIVFHTAGIASLPADSFFIQRIAGLPGERIRIEPPFLIVDGVKVKTPEIFNTISSESNNYAGFQFGGFMTEATDTVTLNAGEYFVLGDNTQNSRDSRYWGALPEENIMGKVTRIYWPLQRINALNQ